MKYVFFVFFILVAQSFAKDIEISIGGTPYVIPVPQDFIPIPTDMKSLEEFSKRFVASENEQFLNLLLEKDINLIREGETPDLARRFFIQAPKRFIYRKITSADFGKMRALMKEHNVKFTQEAATQIPGELGAISQGISNDYRVEMQVSQNQMVSLPIHYNTKNCISYSITSKYTVGVENTSPEAFEGCATTSIVHIKGKLIFLYVSAETGGLEWTRTKSKEWADAIINLNSPPTLHNNSYSLESDWNKTAQIVLVVIIGGCIVILIGYFLKRAFTAS